MALRVAAVAHRAVIQVMLTRLTPDFGLSAERALLSIGVSGNRETDEPPCHCTLQPARLRAGRQAAASDDHERGRDGDDRKQKNRDHGIA